jgi:uncharacterized iron-regulated membrane protein
LPRQSLTPFSITAHKSNLVFKKSKLPQFRQSKRKMLKFIKAHIFATLFVITGLVFLGFCIYLFAEKTASVGETIQTNQVQSQTHVTEASSYEAQASNATVARQTEDGIREQVITPKLEIVRKQSAGSAQNLKVLKQKIKENEKTLHNINANRVANCARLQSLFPDEVFEYCHD